MKPSARIRIAAAIGLCSALGVALWHLQPQHAEVASSPTDTPRAIKSPSTEITPAPLMPVETPLAEAPETHVHGPNCSHGKAAKPGAGKALRMELADNFLQQISQGGGALLELPGGLRIDASKARVEHDEKGVVRIYGNFTSPEPGRLFFQRQDFEGVAGRMVGHVLFDREDALAWKVLPEGEGGAPVLKQVSVDEVICMGMPPQEMPQDHPGSAGVPNPPYQAVIPLQSLPGATGVVYLDFDGEKGPFPGWWDHDAVHSGFNNDTIRDIWIRVAEDFLPFNLNVTTDRKVYDSAPQGQRIHCMISSTYGGGGVAYVGSFNWGGDPICWANSYTGEGAVTVITHEVGHTLGLYHHGINDSEYYGGHGSGTTSWAPIMGVGYGANLKHWSKGDYQGATKPWQDDLNIITTQNNGVAYRADDIGETLATAAYLNVASGGTVTNQQGIIGTTAEVDAFRFKTSGGAVSLNLKTTDFAPNLDILAELVDAASGTVLVSNNPAGDITANISTTVPAGEYLLKITGTGMGSPADLSGYSNYGSLGSYRIDGTVAGAEAFQGFTIAENSAAASSVGTIQPVSLTGTLSFAITGGNAGGAFAIDSATGNLTVANPAAINFETLSTRFDDPADIELFVTISNGGSSEVVRSLVTITNVNEAPTLSGGTSLTLIENTRAGIQLATVTGSDPDRYEFPIYSFASGNEAGFFAIDAGYGRISLINPPVVAADTTFNLVVQAVDNNGLAAPSTVTVSVTVRNVPSTFTGSPGGLYRTFFHNIGGGTVADLTNSPAFPNSPDLETFLTSMDGGGYGDNFGSTMRGYLIPPTSGTYRFWVASDDASQLILGSNATQVSSPVIASVSTYTGQYAWDALPSAASAQISLVAGQPYYIELRHKEGGGGDHAAVAWSGPGISRQVIPGLYLAPFDQNYAPRPSGSLNVAELAAAGTVLGKLPVTDVNAEDSFSEYAITGGTGANLFAIDPVNGNVSLAVAGQFNVPNTLFYDLTFSVKDNGSPALTGTGTVRINVLPANLYFDPNGSTAGSVANAGSYAWIGTNWALSTGGTSATQAWPGNATARFAATNPGAPLAYSVDLAGYNSGTHGNFTGIAASAGTVTFTGNVDNFYLTTPITVTAEAGAALVFNQTRGGADVQAFNLNSQPVTFHGDVTVNSGGIGNNGSVIVGSGNLKLGNAIANYSPAATTIQSGATLTNAGNAGKSFNVGALTLNGGTLAALNSGDASWGNFNLTNGLTVGGTATSVISSDLRCNGNTNQTFNIGETGQDVDLLISGRLGHINNIAWSYATKTGPGTLKISGLNEIGSLTVNQGTLVLEGSTAIAGMWNGGLINNASAELSVPSGSVTSTVALNGAGAYTKSGAGTLTLSTANTYNGPTTVQAGTLVQQSTSASNAHSIAAGAVLEFNTSGTLNGPTTSYSGAGTLRKTGSGSLVWPGTAATFSLGSGSLIDVQAGTMIAGSSANENWSANLSDLNVASGAIFKGVEANVRVNRITGSGTIGTGFNGAGYQNLSIGVDNGSSTFAGTIANTDNNASWPGNLVKLGSGTITLSGSASHTGSTTVSAGKLIVSGAVSATSSVSVASGAELEVSGTLATTGNLTITGTLVLTGAPQLSAGGTITNNGTIINAAPGYTLPANLVNNGNIYNVPAAPSGLSATASPSQVSLTWSAVSGATSYTVKQSSIAGGPYTAIATPTGTSHTATGLTNGTTYYFVVSASNSAGEGPNSAVASATPQPSLPVAPSGLTATAGNAQVALSWNAVSGASGYVVKQSVFAGGPYTTIATPTGTSHTATGLTNGTTYYFVVSATNTAGEGSASAEVSATPQSVLPAPRLATDIGNVGLAGSASFSSGTYTLQGAGAGITGTADACHFVYQTASGDCDVIVRVQSLTNTSTNAMAGVMIRESLTANARCAGMLITPADGIKFTRRSTAGGSTTVSTAKSKLPPHWLRLTRVGNSFRAYYSTNGSTWTQLGNNQTISMASTTYIGIATTSGTTATLCTGVMTNEAVTP
jgi:autotransporter-associated beta strand protein